AIPVPGGKLVNEAILGGNITGPALNATIIGGFGHPSVINETRVPVIDYYGTTSDGLPFYINQVGTGVNDAQVTRINRQFFALAGELQQLQDWLDPSNTASTSRTVWLSGLGRIGKTQLALQYAYTSMDRYDAVFWLNSDTRLALERSCRDVVQKLGLDIEPRSTSREMLILLRQWCSSTDCAYLLILDNIDEVEIDQAVRDIWPPNLNNGSILATSRRPHQKSSPFSFGLEVSAFDAEEGSKFLVSLIHTESFEPNENHQSLVLSERLGGHPLAIAQMAGKIRRRDLTIPEFLQLYDHNRMRIFRIRLPISNPSSYSHDLSSVWLLSFKSLSLESRSLLGIISHLAPDSIPAILLCRDLGEAFFEAVEGLLDSSLATRYSSSSGIVVFSIHRLVQVAFRDYLSLEEREKAFDAATQLVFDALKSSTLDNVTPNPSRCEILQPHIDYLKEFPEARTSKTFDSLLSYSTRNNFYLLNDNKSVASEDTSQDFEFSDVGSVSSQSSAVAEATRSGASLLIDVFRNDVSFVESSRQLLSGAKEEKFLRDFSDLLILFSKDLRVDQTLKSHPQSIEWIESRRQLITQKFLVFLTLSSEDSLTQFLPRQENDNLILNRYLERLDPPTANPDQPLTPSNLTNNVDSND
ncbi:hypothetical protein LSUE1_G008732, partial [Lachnellula suecica]